MGMGAIAAGVDTFQVGLHAQIDFHSAADIHGCDLDLCSLQQFRPRPHADGDNEKVTGQDRPVLESDLVYTSLFITPNLCNRVVQVNVHTAVAERIRGHFGGNLICNRRQDAVCKFHHGHRIHLV